MFNFMRMMGDYEDRKVARDEFDWGCISTAMVTDADQPYETAVGHADYNDGSLVIVEMYDDKDAAVAGHARWIETMKNPPDALRDVSASDIGKLAAAVGCATEFTRRKKEEV